MTASQFLCGLESVLERQSIGSLTCGVQEGRMTASQFLCGLESVLEKQSIGSLTCGVQEGRMTASQFLCGLESVLEKPKHRKPDVQCSTGKDDGDAIPVWP